MIWIKFLISALIIIAAGVKLTQNADILSERLNIGKVWIGVVLLGFVTSLPEAIACLTAVLSLNAPDLAIGNLVGSNNFNVLLIAIMDLVYRQGAITNAIEPNRSQRSSAAFAILLSSLVVLEILKPTQMSGFSIGHVSAGNILIFLIYFYGMSKLSELGNIESVASETVPNKDQQSLTKVYVSLLMSAGFVVVAAVWLTNVCDVIAATTGLGRTFVGSIFLALVTSLPEMVVTLSALRLNAFDLAIGNVFGSNMTNMVFVFLSGLFHTNGPILSYVSKTHVITIILSILLTCIAMLGIKIKNKKTIFNVGWDSLLIIIYFAIGTRLLYDLR